MVFFKHYVIMIIENYKFTFIAFSNTLVNIKTEYKEQKTKQTSFFLNQPPPVLFSVHFFFICFKYRMHRHVHTDTPTYQFCIRKNYASGLCFVIIFYSFSLFR